MALTAANAQGRRRAQPGSAPYPQGLDRGWNDGREFQGRDTGKDDVGFLRAMVNDLARQGIGLDRSAVGVTGISNGGFMAMRMACEAAEEIIGVAAVTASMPAEIGTRCRPARPVPVLVINGTIRLCPIEVGSCGRSAATAVSSGQPSEQ